MSFDVSKYVIRLKGDVKYLPVAGRLVWFREEHPTWRIETEAITLDLDKGVAVFKALIYDEQERVISTGTKMELRANFVDFVEKAETGAIGRALLVAGYGTQFAPELLEGAQSPGEAMSACSECSRPITTAVHEMSAKRYGAPLCPSCQRRHPQPNAGN